MDPQKRFLASTLQGAIDADVVTKENLAKHMTPEVLAEHLPGETLWECIREGMAAADLGTGEGSAPPRPAASSSAVADEGDDEGFSEEDFDGEASAVGDASIDIELADDLDDLPPLPDDEELAVEDVDWDEEKDE